MNATPDERSRLEPLVAAVIRAPRPPSPKRESPPCPDGKFTYESYKQGVEQDIEDTCTISRAQQDAILQHLRTVAPGRFTEADCLRAIELANELEVEAVYTQSTHGDCEKAVDELAAKLPGFSRKLCSRRIGWYGYINR